MNAMESHLDLAGGLIVGQPMVQRRLSDLRGAFDDAAAYDAALAQGDPLVYTVSSVETGDGAGDLHYGLGLIMPGQVGGEYYLTKGHIHRWRDAAEVYVGLGGEGMMLLEDEATGESRALRLAAGIVVYVPPHTFHRTMNTGLTPLTYLGVYPAQAGHDYGAQAERNFRRVVVDINGVAAVLDREAWRVARNGAYAQADENKSSI
ncbi:MAG: glucose-6-phosphate isomerase family protein [Anaerolineae bacterium]